MHGGWSEELIRERMALQLAEAEDRRLARLAAGKTGRSGVRAWAARWLFAFAVAVEREETWREVWDRL